MSQMQKKLYFTKKVLLMGQIVKTDLHTEGFFLQISQQPGKPYEGDIKQKYTNTI